MSIANLSSDRGDRIFQARAKQFIRLYAPTDLVGRDNFIADFMLLFRDLQADQAKVYADALSHHMNLSLQMSALLPTMDKPK